LNSFTNSGAIIFADCSSAGNAAFDNEGELTFLDTSTAGNATFFNEGGKVSGTGGAIIEFDTGSTAGNALITTNGGAVSGASNAETLFRGKAGNATLIANGGSGGGPGGLIHFVDASTGGTTRVEVFGNGNLDVSGHAAPGMTVGSIEGNGRDFLGSTKLTVGSNNLNTTFSGSIRDGGANSGLGGSLAKTGTGALVLARSNTYTGGTIIQRGNLAVNSKVGSGTGIGPVQVNRGFLSGAGTIAGAINVGNGVAAGAVLLPGTAGTPGTLTINESVTFNPLSTYECVLDRTVPAVGKVSALGVIIHSGVTFEFVDRTTGTLPSGAVFTAINNTSANPIGGTFANLPDGTTFSSGGNTFKANYRGGTGNDLILTVQ
jgi:autotransporter-associated beta strand protein